MSFGWALGQHLQEIPHVMRCCLIFNQNWDCWCGWIFRTFSEVSFENKTTNCMVFFPIISIHALYQNRMPVRQLENPTRSTKKLKLLKKKKGKKKKKQRKKKKTIYLCSAREKLPRLGRWCREGVKTVLIGVEMGILSELNQNHRSKEELMMRR